MAERKPPKLYTGIDAATHDALFRAVEDLRALRSALETLGYRTGKRKLAQASRVLGAVLIALEVDDREKILDGFAQKADTYLTEVLDPKAFYVPLTRQEVARRLHGQLSAKRDAGVSRAEVARWLALELEFYRGMWPADPITEESLAAMRANLLAAILRTMPGKGLSSSDPFNEKIASTIKAALKATGMDRDDADQVLKRL